MFVENVNIFYLWNILDCGTLFLKLEMVILPVSAERYDPEESDDEESGETRVSVPSPFLLFNTRIGSQSRLLLIVTKFLIWF